MNVDDYDPSPYLEVEYIPKEDVAVNQEEVDENAQKAAVMMGPQFHVRVLNMSKA